MNRNHHTTTEEMLEALSRSGYLLEAEISKRLIELSFFVETNIVIEDPVSGKSREIDMAAEYYDWNAPASVEKAKAKIEFVFEIKNNIFPLVLLNEFDFSPRVEDWVGLKEAITSPNTVNYDQYENYYEPLIANKRGHIFSQYCSFQKKKQNSELMAMHPENIHSGLAKIIQYCEECAEGWGEESEEDEAHVETYLRHFLCMPVLVIKDNLYELKDGKLIKTDSSILVVNYYHKNLPTMAYVFVITKNGLDSFLEQTLQLESEINDKLIALRKNNA
ncbi:MAG: hypothetical protein RPU64_16630 [Candidatus Sedimenticola sp. (ex Thyasira tokunagai)]